MNNTQLEQTLHTYYTVLQFCELHKAFSVGGIRHLIFHESSNGLEKSGAIVRMGRKILINEQKFFSWLESQNKQGVHNA